MDQETAQRIVDSYLTWHQRFEIFPGVVTPGVYSPDFLLKLVDWPISMRGRRVLDVGACDGFFTHYFSGLGAEVVALDYKSRFLSGFSAMERVLEKSFRHYHCNIYDILSLGFQPFDFVLCFGVFYHLPDPVRAMWLLRQLCSNEIWIETHVEYFEGDVPAARYYPGATWAGDNSNFWAPNVACVRAVMQDVGFRVLSIKTFGDRAIVHAVVENSLDAGAKLTQGYGLLRTSLE